MTHIIAEWNASTGFAGTMGDRILFVALVVLFGIVVWLAFRLREAEGTAAQAQHGAQGRGIGEPLVSFAIPFPDRHWADHIRSRHSLSQVGPPVYAPGRFLAKVDEDMAHIFRDDARYGEMGELRER